uniref:PARP alpha-helical domain-containing protein n=1 Tax=Panagrolaimus davidi TaxID=227884 RepID=A0A914QEV8_9BILA
MSIAVVERISVSSNSTMIEMETQKTTETKIIKYNPEMEIIEDDEINVIEITPKILLPKALYNLMQRIFDPNVLTAALKGMKLDLQKLSVGELTQDQISAARRILKELAQVRVNRGFKKL